LTNHSENTPKSNEIRVLINIGDHFIDENNIRSVARFGKGTRIFLTNGQEIVTAVSYDRVADIVTNTSK
jgi:hypothetical protein